MPVTQRRCGRDARRWRDRVSRAGATPRTARAILRSRCFKSFREAVVYEDKRVAGEIEPAVFGEQADPRRSPTSAPRRAQIARVRQRTLRSGSSWFIRHSMDDAYG